MPLMPSDELLFPEFADVLPIADRAAFSGRSPSEIRDWSISQADKYRKIMLAHLSIHNAFVPIHTLPNEVLSMILAYCWHDRKSLYVTHVCRRWRAVALKTPDLWADAASQDVFKFDSRDVFPPEYGVVVEYISAVVARSAPRSLILRFDHFPENTFNGIFKVHETRVVSFCVDLYASEELEALYEALRDGLSYLEELEVGLRKTSDDQRAHDMFNDVGHWYNRWEDLPIDRTVLRDRLPRLKTLTIPGILFALFSRKSLQHVKLTGDVIHTRIPTTDHLCTVLSICTGLLSLDLTHALPLDIQGALGSPSTTRIRLPTLETLIVEDIPESAACVLSLFAPLPPTLRFHCYRRNPTTKLLLQPFRRNEDVLRSLLHPIHSFVFYSDLLNLAMEFTITRKASSDHKEHIRIDGDVHVNDLIDVFRPCSITHLTIDVDHHMRTAEDPDFFSAFPHLVSLHIPRSDARTWLTSLKTLDERQDSQSLACPSLRHFVVTLEVCIDDGLRAELARKTKSPALAALLREHCVPFLAGILAHRASRGSRAATLLLSVFQKGYAMRRKRMQPVPRIALDELEWTGAAGGSFDSEVGLDTLRNLVGESATLGTISFCP